MPDTLVSSLTMIQYEFPCMSSIFLQFKGFPKPPPIFQLNVQDYHVILTIINAQILSLNELKQESVTSWL